MQSISNSKFKFFIKGFSHQLKNTKLIGVDREYFYFSSSVSDFFQESAVEISAYLKDKKFTISPLRNFEYYQGLYRAAYSIEGGSRIDFLANFIRN